MTHTGYVSADEIMADVYGLVGDPGGDRFSDGFMLSQIQQALTELAYDTYFDERTAIIPINRCTTLDLPVGMFNIDKVFVFNGNECSNSNTRVVWWAKGWVRKGAGRGYKEQQGQNHDDPIMEDVMFSPDVGTLLYWNTLNGKLMLSDACAGFDNVFLKYRGLGCDFKSAPCIPHYLREAVKNMTAIAALKHRFAEDPSRWGVVLETVKRDHFGNGSFSNPGTWVQAKRRVVATDSKARDDISKYLSQLSLNIF